MKQRTGLIKLFLKLTAVLGAGVIIIGGCVTWKLIHSTTPKLERATTDPEQMLERTIAARLEETPNDKTDSPVDGDEKTNTKTEKVTPSQDEENDAYWEYEEEEYYDEEYFRNEVKERKETKTAEKSAQEFSYTLEDVSEPAKTSRPAKKSKTSSSRSSAPKVIYASYKQGLLQCQKSQAFPCIWKDNTGPLVKQYLLKSSQGPVERIIYAHNGKIISQTFSTLSGAVTRYQGSYAELYFENDLLTKIRTFPYDNPNLRDWFLIGKDGKISACLCGIPTKDCCARSSLYREGGPRRYCDLFPLDADYCSK